MMCASTALLLAKYYKRMWPNESLCGVEVWFAVSLSYIIVVSMYQLLCVAYHTALFRGYARLFLYR